MLMSQKENVQCDIKVDRDRHEEMEVDGKKRKSFFNARKRPYIG